MSENDFLSYKRFNRNLSSIKFYPLLNHRTYHFSFHFFIPCKHGLSTEVSLYLAFCTLNPTTCTAHTYIHYEQRPTRACRQLKVKALRKPGETAMGVSMRRCCHLKRHLFIVGEHVFISCLHRLWVRAEPTRSL